MALLPYEVLQADIDEWGTLASIQANLQVDGDKQLQIALDPLIDPTVIDPAAAYYVDGGD